MDTLYLNVPPSTGRFTFTDNINDIDNIDSLDFDKNSFTYYGLYVLNSYDRTASSSPSLLFNNFKLAEWDSRESGDEKLPFSKDKGIMPTVYSYNNTLTKQRVLGVVDGYTIVERSYIFTALDGADNIAIMIPDKDNKYTIPLCGSVVPRIVVPASRGRYCLYVVTIPLIVEPKVLGSSTFIYNGVSHTATVSIRTVSSLSLDSILGLKNSAVLAACRVSDSITGQKTAFTGTCTTTSVYDDVNKDNSVYQIRNTITATADMVIDSISYGSSSNSESTRSILVNISPPVSMTVGASLTLNFDVTIGWSLP